MGQFVHKTGFATGLRSITKASMNDYQPVIYKYKPDHGFNRHQLPVTNQISNPTRRPFSRRPTACFRKAPWRKVGRCMESQWRCLNMYWGKRARAGGGVGGLMSVVVTWGPRFFLVLNWQNDWLIDRHDWQTFPFNKGWYKLICWLKRLIFTARKRSLRR